VQSPAYLAVVGEMVKTVPMDKWRSYLRAVVLRSASGDLSKAFVDEQFAWRQALTGQKELEPRWKRCVRETEGALGEDLGQEFIAVAFPGDSKQVALDMVNAVLLAFRQRLPGLDWMDADTRARAGEKLDTFRPHIGYPNKFKTYDFKVARGSHFANDMAASRWGTTWVFSRIGKPVDREEWFMFPQTVNAYYNPLKNEIAFPAGILQPPFFASRAALAVNLGGIGMVIGHEITHGFDDEGSHFAPDGNLKEWWTAESRKKFDERTACVERQYEKYEPLPGVKLSGKLTLGENIADLGGVIVAHKAWQNLRGDAPETINAEGFTEEQLLFLNVGQIWCFKARDEAVRQLAKTDPHSPAKFRVNGPLSNTPAFHQAFGCKVGQKMRPVDDGKMCRIW
jgi:putative endopeptidase